MSSKTLQLPVKIYYWVTKWLGISPKYHVVVVLALIHPNERTQGCFYKCVDFWNSLKNTNWQFVKDVHSLAESGITIIATTIRKYWWCSITIFNWVRLGLRVIERKNLSFGLHEQNGSQRILLDFCLELELLHFVVTSTTNQFNILVIFNSN